MLSYVIDMKFSSLDQAKVVNSYLTGTLSECLEVPGINGINTFIGQKGELTTTIKIENKEAVEDVKGQIEKMLETLRTSMVFQSRLFLSVCSYQYERQGVTTSL